MNINHFIITGNVTRPLELCYTPKGTPTVTYTVACNDFWYDEGGVKHEDCDYIPITTIGRQAERDAKYLGQGSPVAVEGRIQSWYQPAEKRGGFNFKALRVQYLGRPDAPRSEAASQGAREKPTRGCATTRRQKALKALHPTPTGSDRSAHRRTYVTAQLQHHSAR